MTKHKKSTQLERLLSILSDQQWHWGDELAVKVGHRFNATVFRARNLGHDIQKERIGLKNQYRLL